MTTITASEKIGLGVLKLLGWVALLAASSIWRGYVLSILWGWFMVTAFSLPPLTIPLAIGVSLIAGFLTMQVPNKGREDDTPELVARAVMAPAMCLLLGWIVTKFI